MSSMETPWKANHVNAAFQIYTFLSLWHFCGKYQTYNTILNIQLQIYIFSWWLSRKMPHTQEEFNQRKLSEDNKVSLDRGLTEQRENKDTRGPATVGSCDRLWSLRRETLSEKWVHGKVARQDEQQTQKLINYGPWPVTHFVNKVLLECSQTHLLTHCTVCTYFTIQLRGNSDRNCIVYSI